MQRITQRLPLATSTVVVILAAVAALPCRSGAEDLAEKIKKAKEYTITKEKADRTKWWIKVCTAQTDADRIEFAVGPDQDSIVARFTWDRSKPTEFDVPDLADFEKVYVYANAVPHKKNAYFGVCYHEQVCNKHYDFDKDEDHDVRKTDTDEWKCTRRAKPVIPEKP
jgi:hypothetical protein